MTLAFTVLGGFQLRHDGTAVALPTRKAQATAAYREMDMTFWRARAAAALA